MAKVSDDDRAEANRRALAALARGDDLDTIFEAVADLTSGTTPSRVKKSYRGRRSSDGSTQRTTEAPDVGDSASHGRTSRPVVVNSTSAHRGPRRHFSPSRITGSPVRTS